ncbi:MAG: glycosyl hydrolase family 28 protein [Kiritimatiellia bacterium]
MKRMSFWLFALMMASGIQAKEFLAKDYGIAPGKAFTAADVTRLLAEVAAVKERNVVIFDKGVYDVGPAQCVKRTWFISNHDQWNPKTVFLPIENLTNVTFKGNGAFINLKGRIIPFGLWDCEGVTLENFSIDYEMPPLTQINLLAADAAAKTVTFKTLPGVAWELKGTRLFFKGSDWRNSPSGGTLFDPDGTIAYRTGDFGFNLSNVIANADGSFTAHGLGQKDFKAGQTMALRAWERPAPGIVLSTSKNSSLLGMNIYYSDGMGVIAQGCENITIDHLKIVPNQEKGRTHSTQADATHFSGCRGMIRSVNGEYVGMMDDAINVHGTYLRVQKRIDARTLDCAYMHGQAYGFFWGSAGDQVQFVRSKTMEIIGEKPVKILSLATLDKPTVTEGAKQFRITFAEDLPAEIDPAQGPLGIENLTWTPEVVFSHNRIANNRARGALFSTPKRVLCTDNVFDHVSGCAVLLCGDCNGWYETGACRDVIIRNNRFINALTSNFQFTEAVISICPEIPQLNQQSKYFHSGIIIEKNVFETFDRPLVFAKSVNGLTIRDNTVIRNHDFPAWHWNKDWLTTRRVTNQRIEAPREIQSK